MDQEGFCGYVAAGILLYWADECKGQDDFINDWTFLNKERTGFRDEAFTKYLCTLGTGDATTAGPIRNVLQQYLIKCYAYNSHCTDKSGNYL